MVRPHLQKGKVFDFNLPGIIAKYDDVEGIFGITRGDEFRKRHGHPFGGGNPVFAVEDHRVRDIDHQHGTGLALVESFVYLQVLVGQLELFDAVVDLGIAE